MQREIALSSTESKYTGLSYALHETIPIMELFREMERRKVKVAMTAAIKCKVYEDNSEGTGKWQKPTSTGHTSST